jgi:pimeloyl-ACP methyl ester carboxylesterase
LTAPEAERQHEVRNGLPDAISAIWIEELSRWGARRANTIVRMVPGAGHHVARDEAAVVVDAVRKLLRADDR